MAYVDIVTALALIQFTVFGFKVGGARGRFGVKAPAPPRAEPWGLTIAYVFDPSGVLWHFAQPTEDVVPT
jgi:hypothetical protein